MENMKIGTENLIEVSKNDNIQVITEKVDKLDTVVILKDNKPAYFITKVDSGVLSSSESAQIETAAIEKIAKDILKKNKRAFEVLGNC